LQERLCVSQAMQAASEAFGFDEVPIRVTQSSWVHTRTDNLPQVQQLSATAASARAPSAATVDVASDDEADEVDAVADVDE
jgi:hypothetical protein